jgi:hypothetical protein
MKYCEVKRTFAALRPPMQTMHYEPVTHNENSHIGILVIHSNGDYLEQPAGKELAKRGYHVLCANIPNPGKALEKKLADVKRAYEYLKQVSGVDKILIFGHSGGATLMSAYQAVAENGSSVFQGDEKIYKMPDVETLPAADGVLLIDSNWGNGAMTLLSLDPAVVDENCGSRLDPELDIFSEQNGFDPNGNTQYSEAFIRKFMAAQRERGQWLVKYARERVYALEHGKGYYADDEPLLIPGGEQLAPCNKLLPEDAHLLSHTKQKWMLLRGDYSRKTEVVRTLRHQMCNENPTRYYGRGTLVTTVRSFLASSAVLATEDYFMDESGIYGIDYDSSYCCTPGNVHHISAPTLVMGMNAGYEFMAAEEVYRNLKSKDKTLAFVNGVNHPLRIATDLEKYAGEFGDPLANMYDYISEWIEARFNR